MPNRIAVLCDIHGNLPALEAVLADVEALGVDRIVLDGDLADGPFPVETLDRLAALGDRALWLRGNGDRWLVEARAGPSPMPIPRRTPSSDGPRRASPIIFSDAWPRYP